MSAAKILSTLPKSNLYLQYETKIMKSGETRADEQNSTRFQQIVPPQDYIEFSVDPFNPFLSRPARACA